MSETNIEWTNYTWNPWIGCKKVSAGCKNCYMYREQTQRGNDPTIIRRTKTLNDPLRWERKAIADNKKYMVFTCSYSDFFLEESDEWRDDAWDIIRRTPHLIYQILTKRIERVNQCLPEDFPFENVWLGVSAENQETADYRIPLLFETPAALRFISVEPMLGPINIWNITWDFEQDDKELANWSRGANYYDWFICGCESGKNARPMNIDWVRNLRDQCKIAGIPFFLKQMEIDGKLTRMPELDGKVWAEYPEVTK